MSENTAPAADSPQYTNLPVGEILRRTRTHYGQSLSQVESILRIRAIQLEAIETGELDKLPGRVYAIGFVRAYSEYLGLDGDKMVKLFKEQSVGSKSRPELQFPVPARESKAPSFGFVLYGGVAVILLLFAWSLFLSPDHSVESIPPVPETLQETTITEAPPIITAEQPETTLGAPPPELPEVEAKQITLELIDNSWIEIRTKDGAAILRQVLKTGDKYIVPMEEGLVLSTGNAGGFKVFVGGKEVAPIGKPAQIKRNVPLNPEQLLKESP